MNLRVPRIITRIDFVVAVYGSDQLQVNPLESQLLFKTKLAPAGKLTWRGLLFAILEIPYYCRLSLSTLASYTIRRVGFK